MDAPAAVRRGWRFPRRGRVTFCLALVLALLLVGHRHVPDAGGLATALESVLPWSGLLVLLLLAAATVRRSPLALAATTLPLLVWTSLFGHDLLPRGAGGQPQLHVLSQNIGAGNAEPADAAQALADRHADIVSVQELTDANSSSVHAALDSGYAHRAGVGTIEVWSRYPLSEAVPLDLGLTYARALHTVADTPQGRVSIYAVHLASVRVGADAQRNAGLSQLTALLRADSTGHLIVLGDLNTATTDRAFDELAPWMHDTQEAAGGGFGFTWPAGLPITRPDHVLIRGFVATDSIVLPAHGSDHRAIEAGLRLS